MVMLVGLPQAVHRHRRDADAQDSLATADMGAGHGADHGVEQGDLRLRAIGVAWCPIPDRLAFGASVQGHAEDSPVLKGIVEIDGAYAGAPPRKRAKLEHEDADPPPPNR
jgi:hypothetical protein